CSSDVCSSDLHKADVQTSVVIKIKLIGHIINGRGADHSSEYLSGNRKASDPSGFNGKGHHIQHPVFPGVSGNHFRDSDTNIDNIVHPQLLGRSPADDISHHTVFRLL